MRHIKQTVKHQMCFILSLIQNTRGTSCRQELNGSLLAPRQKTKAKVSTDRPVVHSDVLLRILNLLDINKLILSCSVPPLSHHAPAKKRHLCFDFTQNPDLYRCMYYNQSLHRFTYFRTSPRVRRQSPTGSILLFQEMQCKANISREEENSCYRQREKL